MKRLATRFVKASLLCVILLTPAHRLTARTQPRSESTAWAAQGQANKRQGQRRLTDEEARTHFFRLMEDRLKASRRFKSGWQTAHVTKHGTHLLSLVRGGRIVEFAVGDSKTREALVRYAPAGVKGPGPRGAGTPGRETDPDPPPFSECWRRYVSCVGGNDFFSDLWDAIKVGVGVITLDPELLEETLEERRRKFEECMGRCMEGTQQ